MSVTAAALARTAGSRVIAEPARDARSARLAASSAAIVPVPPARPLARVTISAVFCRAKASQRRICGSMSRSVVASSAGVLLAWPLMHFLANYQLTSTVVVTSINLPILLKSVGLGILGYFLGAARLGTVTIVVSVVTLFLGIAATQGVIPGLEPSDRGLPAVEPRAAE